MFYFPCSPVHKIGLLFTEVNNEDKHIFRDGERRKQSANFKQTQRKQIIYFHVNRYIIWICQRFVKQNKVLRFPVHRRRLINLQKDVNIEHYYKNKQNINPAHIQKSWIVCTFAYPRWRFLQARYFHKDFLMKYFVRGCRHFS